MTSKEKIADDHALMRRAIELGRQGRYSTSPNPMVGAIIARDGEILGEGWHERTGEDHAELRAIADAGGIVRGTTLYVTLEPCNHHGRTPPCVESILDNGIARVVIATEDPSGAMSGKSIARLREAGIEVTTGIEREAAEEMNEVFLLAVRAQRPFVALKVAMTLDGKMATHTGMSQWITSERSRERALDLRETYDSIMVGGGTVASDDPRLTRRLGFNSSIQPWTRIVLDSSGTIPLDAALLTDQVAKTVVFTSDPSRLAGSSCETVSAPGTDDRIDLDFVMQNLRERGLRSILVEGGPTIAGEILNRGLCDKLYVFVAPLLVGGDDRYSIFPGNAIGTLDDALGFRFTSVEQLEPDLLLVATPDRR